MYGLPINTCSQSAGLSRSSNGPSASSFSSDPDPGDQLLHGNTGMPSPPLPPSGAGASQGTISLTAEQFTAMMTRMGTLEATVTQLNASASQPQSQTHGNLLQSNLKSKMPDVYTGKSHKKLHEFFRQCVEHFEALNCEVNHPSSIAFAASLLRGNTTGPMWVDYRSSLAPGHIVTWDEFKKVLRDDLGDEDAFIDKTWSKFFSYHQRSNESVRSFTTTLHQLRSILQEYDPLLLPSESLMIRRLRSALRPEICAALYNTDERVKSYSAFLNKVMSAEASASMRAAGSARTNKRDRSRDVSPEQPNQRDKSASNRRGKKRNRDSTTDAGKSSDKTPATGSNADAEVICFTCNKPGHKSPACPDKPKPKPKN